MATSSSTRPPGSPSQAPPSPGSPSPAGGKVTKALDAGSKRASKTVRDSPLMPLALAGVGFYLMWFGIHYWRDTVTVWPTDPIKALLQGKPLPAPDPESSAAATLDSIETQTAAASPGPASSPGGSAPQGPVPAGSAQNTARLLLGKYGWTAAEMGPLILLWNRESGWSANARNPTSGAFGIAQALGHGGEGTAAPDGTNEYGAEYGLTAAEAQQANAGDARWQIEWGLGYIKATYGSPSAAWAHEESAGWY